MNPNVSSLFQHGVQLEGQVVEHVADVVQDVHRAAGPGRAEGMVLILVK